MSKRMRLLGRDGPVWQTGAAQSPLDVLREDGFVEINSEQMAISRFTFENETVLKVAARIAITEVMGGGVLITLKGKTLTGRLAEVQEQIWADFASKVLKNMWMYGFVVVGSQEHPDLVGIPYVVDLELARVFIRRSINGNADYAVFDTSAQSNPTAVMEPVPMLDVRVFEFEPPNSWGNLRSVAYQVWQRRDTLNHLLLAEKAAVSQNAQPMVLLQDTTPRQNELGPISDMTSEAHLRMLGQISSMQETIASISCTVNNNRGALTNPQNARDLSVAGGIKQAMMQNPLFNEAVQPISQPTRYLPQGYAVARGPEAREPSNLMDMLTNFEEMVGALLGVPRSFWAQFSGQKSSNSPDARLMYRSGQRFIKQRLAPLCTSVARWINTDAMAEAVVKEKEAQYISSVDDLISEIDIQVIFPGLPPEEELKEMFDVGMLSEEAYVTYLSKIHGIPLSHFNKAQTLPKHVPDPNMQAKVALLKAQQTGAPKKGKKRKQ